MVNQTIESSIVRVHTSDGDLAGAGFLIGDQRVLTCAHVVAATLGISADEPKMPIDEVLLYFPLVDLERKLMARVIQWDTERDVAGLELSDAPPAGAQPVRLVAFIPRELDPAGETVRRFIERGIARLPAPESAPEPMTPAELDDRIAAWAERLGVEVDRVQLLEMRTKWASCSSQGTLTLHCDLLRMPRDLVDYVLCHELLHRKVPDHNQSWQLLMGMHISDWRQRERRLAGWMVRGLSRIYPPTE